MERAERKQANIHMPMELAGGAYANFATVASSPYEFTITFARVEHEAEGPEMPGVVVARINVSPKFMAELIDAMKDNYSKYAAVEEIRNLPELDGDGDGDGDATTN